MAQKREKEETELKVPETLIRTTPIPSPPKLSSSDDSTSSNSSRSDPPPDNNMIHKNDDDSRSCSVRSPERSSDLTSPPHHLPHLRRARLQQPPVAAATEVKRREVNRCSGCKRKVGLTGFRCRCGDLFCSEHRYSDRHDCSFDYKAAGREAIARENPVVRAAKILKV